MRNFLLRLFNKEFLIFLCFLFLSAVFWLLTTLNQTYEYELSLDVRLTNVPKNVVITSEPPATIKVIVRDKGYMIGGYIYGGVMKPITMDFAACSNGKGHGCMTNAELQRRLYRQFYKSSAIVAVKPDKLEFLYNLGQHKRVPVKLLGRVVPEKGYYLAKVNLEPDSATVYAAKGLLDSISVVYVTPQQAINFRDTVKRDAPLRKIASAKILPETVRLTLIPDVLAEEVVEVPIEAVNMPEHMVLRTFPSKLKVYFVVGARQLRNMPKSAETKQLLPRGFRVVADYQDIINSQSDRCRVTLRSTPSGVRNARLEAAEVDYLLEQQ